MQELLSVTQGTGVTPYAWDAAGNLAASGGVAYTFDAVNRLTKVQSGSTTVEYGYDADGRRVWQRSAGQDTWFVFDGLAPIMELGTHKKPTTLLVPGVSKTRLDLPEPFTEWELGDRP